MRAIRSAMLPAVSGLLAGCSNIARLPPAPPVPAETAGYLPSLPLYRVQIGDVLTVKVVQNPDLSEDVTVRPDGRISTWAVQDEIAYNQTLPELAERLREDYSKDLRRPRLSVQVKSYAPYRIYVAGEVTLPGEYSEIGPNLTLSQAIARAGGVKVSGDASKVFILRRGPNDVPQLFSTRYNDILAGRDAGADVRLAQYDVVFVPRTSIAEVYVLFNQYLQQFVPVSWGFSYVLPSGGGTSVVPSASAAPAAAAGR